MKQARQLVGIAVVALFAGHGVHAQAVPAADVFNGHPRVIVISDIGNEPDDQMSFVRLMLYSNELDLEGLIASTSTWLRTSPNPQTMRDIIEAYGEVRPNLAKHASGWPEASALAALVSTGQNDYGMAATGPDKLSDGAQAIIRAADKLDTRPLWISVWGGVNTLAEALQHVRATRTPDQVEAFVGKLRVYSISDQDDAGPWIRREFPHLFYIAKPSTQDGSEYSYATWTGISGDIFYRNGEGADSSTVTNAWLETNIRSKGSLGKHYPKFAYIMEGDTPAFLGLIDNGLASWQSPSWGGWGGRYVWREPYGESRAMWTQGGDVGGMRVTSQDTVTGSDGRTHVSDQATIWRWRQAFQNDFAARMDWTVKAYGKANHNPVAVVNNIAGTQPIVIDADVGQSLVLDASRSHDPDGQKLHFHWISYPEAGFVPGQTLGEIVIHGEDTSRVKVMPVAPCRIEWGGRRPDCALGVAHIILEVTDNGSPALTSYRRVIINVHGRGHE